MKDGNQGYVIKIIYGFTFQILGSKNRLFVILQENQFKVHCGKILRVMFGNCFSI